MKVVLYHFQLKCDSYNIRTAYLVMGGNRDCQDNRHPE